MIEGGINYVENVYNRAVIRHVQRERGSKGLLLIGLPERLGQLDDSFAAMEAGMAELLTPEGHEPCKELRSECTEVQLKWEELKKRVERILAFEDVKGYPFSEILCCTLTFDPLYYLQHLSSLLCLLCLWQLIFCLHN